MKMKLGLSKGADRGGLLPVADQQELRGRHQLEERGGHRRDAMLGDHGNRTGRISDEGHVFVLKSPSSVIMTQYLTRFHSSTTLTTMSTT